MFRTGLAAVALIGAIAPLFAAEKPMPPKPLFSIRGENGRDYPVESLGRPVAAKDCDVTVVTGDPAGGRIAWGVVASQDAFGILGQNTGGGPSRWIDLAPFGNNRAAVAAWRDSLFIITGSPLKVLRYDLACGKLEVLKEYPAIVNAFWHDGYAISRDGKFYVGVYPGTMLVGIDMNTGKAFEQLQLQKDPEQKYIILPAVDDQDILYAPVGLARPELYTLDLKTGTIRQILTPEQQKQLIADRVFRPLVYLEADGAVYTKVGSQYFRCGSENLTPCEPRKFAKFPNNLRNSSMLAVGKERVVRFGENGLLMVAGSGANAKLRYVPTDREPAGIDVFGAHEVRDGVLYGSSVFPGRIFAVDLRKMTGNDLGFITNGQIQCYDIINLPAGLVLSSYVGANLNFFDPAKPIAKGENPRHIRSLEDVDQERIQRLTRVGDHLVYGGTVPRKGALGGGVMKLDTRDFSVKFERNVIPDQSIKSMVAIPGGPLLCGASSIEGGTGAAPKAKEAELFLWDSATDRMVWHRVAVPGATRYSGLTVTAEGKVLAIAHLPAETRWLVFDPATRQISASGKLDTAHKGDFYTQPEAMGPERQNFLFGGGELWAYADGKIDRVFQDARLAGRSWQFLHIEPDGWMYFPLDTRLLRMKLF